MAPIARPLAADVIPDALREWLDGWGSGLQRAIDTGVAAAHVHLGLSTAAMPPQRLSVGTDCSGIDAPIHGLRGLSIPHKHIFGSEVAAAPRSVIEANTKPSQALFHSVLDADTAPFVHLYVAGFSCKPFSLLHNKTKLLGEDQAKIFYAVVARIQQVRPACFVLENVTGIKRVSAEVLKLLRSKGYLVEMILMNPAELQEPIQRPRYYFIAVRQDVSLISPRNLLPWLREAWAKVKQAAAPDEAVPLLDRLLPASHPAVVQYQEALKRKWLQACNRGFAGSQAPRSKWQELHKKCRASVQKCSRLKKPCTESGAPCCADTLFLHLPREREAWDIICEQHAGSEDIVADVSQNVNRARVRTDGSLPTATPGALLVSSRAGRIISPLEKVMIHGFPIHRMVFPSKLTDQELASMGGNTMHVQIVAVAMKFALSLVDWSKPMASRPAALPSTQVAVEVSRGRKHKAQRGPKAQKAPRLPGSKVPRWPLHQPGDEVLGALTRRWQQKVNPRRAKQPRCSRPRTKVRKQQKTTTGPKLLIRLANRWGLVVR